MPCIKSATYTLADLDPLLASLIAIIGPCEFRERSDPFVHLVNTVIGQQLSYSAARAIRDRFWTTIGISPTPRQVILLDDASLVGVGLSKQKLRTIRELAGAIDTGSLDLISLNDVADAEAISSLTQVHGIGRWTAEMFLIFCMHRLDVFPEHDTAVKNAMARCYKIKPGDKEGFRTISEKWRPYRSIACWYLYRFLDLPKAQQDEALNGASLRK